MRLVEPRTDALKQSKKPMYRTVLLGLCILCLPGEGVGQVSIQITVRSYHFERDDFTEWNLGMGIGYDFGPGTVEVGLYRNSNGDPSVYNVFTKSTPNEGNAGMIVGVGSVLGYPGGPRPLLIPGGFFSKNPRLRILYAPPPGNLFFSQVSYAPGMEGTERPKNER